MVREAFDTYLERGGLAQAAKQLNDRGFRFTRERVGGGPRGRIGYFTVDNLQGLLKNSAYVGIRTYTEHGEVKTTKACWPAIVDQEKFDRVQRIMSKNFADKVKLSYPNRFPFLLANLMVCGQCGDALPGKSAHGNGGKIPYYEHGWAVKKQSSLSKKIFQCNPTRFLAKTVEPLVWNDVVQFLSNEKLAVELIQKAGIVHESKALVTENDKLRRKLRGVEDQLDALAEHLSRIPKTVSPTPIYSQMEQLSSMKNDIQHELDKLTSSADFADKPVSLTDYQSYLKVLCTLLHQFALPEEKNALIKALVHKIELFPDVVKIYYLVGETSILDRKDQMEESIERAGESQLTSISDKKTKTADQGKFLVRGSNNELQSSGGWI